MGKQERQERKDRRAEKAFEVAGLHWDDNGDIRTQAFYEGMNQMESQGFLSTHIKSTLLAAGAMMVGRPGVALASAIKATKNIREGWDVFKEAFNRGIETARRAQEAFNRAIEAAERVQKALGEPEPEVRAQVDIAEVAGALPWQAAAMVGDAKKPTPWWYFAIPAGVLFLILQRGR